MQLDNLDLVDKEENQALREVLGLQVHQAVHLREANQDHQETEVSLENQVHLAHQEHVVKQEKEENLALLDPRVHKVRGEDLGRPDNLDQVAHQELEVK